MSTEPLTMDVFHSRLEEIEKDYKEQTDYIQNKYNFISYSNEIETFKDIDNICHTTTINLYELFKTLFLSNTLKTRESKELKLKEHQEIRNEFKLYTNKVLDDIMSKTKV